MKLFVLDTHAYLFYLKKDLISVSSIVKKFFFMCEANECIFYIPTICFWEINRKIVDRKVKVLDLSPEEALKLAHKTIEDSPGFRDLPLTRRAASMASSFSIKLPDPFDQLIVASALDADLPLITKDINIQKSKLVRTVW